MKHLYIFLFLIAFQSINAQVLWSDDFDSHPVGLLSTDITGVTPGYGGWYVKTPKSQIRIVQEAGRGNVMTKGWSQHTVESTHEGVYQENLDALWNGRNRTNNIFKLEFEMQALSYSPSFNGYLIDYVNIIFKNNNFSEQFRCRVDKNDASIALGKTSGKMIYNHNWIKVEIFVDYNTNTLHYYVPNYLFLKESHTIIEEPNKLSLNTYFYGGFVGSTGLIKYDNIKISAIPTLPSYLNVDEFLASKFNVFPNPATDVVTITNTENINVKQIEIYDVTGKNIKSQGYNNENEIQLNISDFAAGTYMFHIKTNQGTAVKKVVKK